MVCFICPEAICDARCRGGIAPQVVVFDGKTLIRQRFGRIISPGTALRRPRFSAHSTLWGGGALSELSPLLTLQRRLTLKPYHASHRTCRARRFFVGCRMWDRTMHSLYLPKNLTLPISPITIPGYRTVDNQQGIAHPSYTPRGNARRICPHVYPLTQQYQYCHEGKI